MISVFALDFLTSLRTTVHSSFTLPSSESLLRSMYSLPSAVLAIFTALVSVVVELRALFNFNLLSDFTFDAAISA